MRVGENGRRASEAGAIRLQTAGQLRSNCRLRDGWTINRSRRTLAIFSVFSFY